MTTPLGRQIEALIRAEGAITLARYMAIALMDPVHGYYATRDPFGPQGDFVTAPEISQMFGELIGLWAAHAFESGGSPSQVTLAELGPGRGTLMRDALRAIGQAKPSFREALSVHLVEASPTLRAVQRASLGDFGACVWHDGIETLPDGPIIVIANEFFDALPVRQFVRREGAWFERLVGLVDDRLGFVSSVAAEVGPGLPQSADGAILEFSIEGAGIMGSLARRVAREGGACLIVDYGHLESGFGDTLQAVRRHEPVGVFDAPGEADLTAHVDFASLARIADAEGASVDILTSQADFLEAIGIGARAQALRRGATPDEAEAVTQALARLTDRSPTGMGSLFKVMAIGRQASV